MILTSFSWTGPLAECDRVGAGRADYSHKQRRHGVNVQVITHSGGRLLWLSTTLPGRTHDLTAARTTGSSESASARAFPWWPTSHTRAAALAGTHPYREHPQPGPGRGTGTRRTRRCPPEGMADLQQIPMQPHLHDVDRQGRSHPGVATLKRLTACPADCSAEVKSADSPARPPELPCVSGEE